jgi:hypothetical protein
MKRVLKILAFLIFIGSLTSFVRFGGNEKPVPVVRAALIGWIQRDSAFSLSAKVWLINNSPDTIYYQSMTCSWQDVYKTNTDSLVVGINICTKNTLGQRKIAPQSSSIDDITLSKDGAQLPNITAKEKQNLTGLTFNIGFHFVRSSKGYIFHDSGFDGKDTTIWSNPIKITEELPVTSFR